MDTVVTLRADVAEDHIARFRAWGGSLHDMGVCDGVRRVRVDAAEWRGYTREVAAPRTPQTTIPLFACGGAGCKVRATAGGLASHQRATGHAGRLEDP